MALFQKKPQVSSSAPLYTLGLNKTVLVVGLGNVGKEYEGTRHNIGFECIDYFAEKTDLGTWVEKKDLKCRMVNGMAGDTRVIAIKPTTFMNLSGEAVQATMHFYKIPNNQVIVVHDELDIPFGQIRTRIGGSSAGNNGIKSLIQHLGEEFARVRIGIRNDLAEKQDGSEFVLDKFNKEETAQLKNLKKEVTSILTEYIYSGQLNPETRSFIL
jgi:peptidyl-tRNA hydrolase, PTH1 family